jgi:hypothetical protein
VGSSDSHDVKRLARIVVAAYALAILVAGMAPHCDWMFASAQAATANSGHAEHDANSTDHTTPAKKSERDCAAMEMAKSVGPLPAVLTIASPDVTIAAAVVPETPTFDAPVIVDAVQPRGPPRTGGGFAAVFAANHRLLI